MRAIGIVETLGLPGAIEAADAMLKAANVRLVDQKKVGSGLIAIVVQGDVGAVQAAVESGRAAAAKVGKVIATNVLPNPHREVEKMLPNLEVKEVKEVKEVNEVEGVKSQEKIGGEG